MIRTWHRTIVEQCGTYTANRAKSHLKSILALAEEDFSVRAPSMPTGLSRARHKPKKAILTSEDIRRLIADGQGGSRARRLLRLPVPCRHATVRATWACCGARWTLTTTSSASAASRSATAR